MGKNCKKIILRLFVIKNRLDKFITNLKRINEHYSLYDDSPKNYSDASKASVDMRYFRIWQKWR